MKKEIPIKGKLIIQGIEKNFFGSIVLEERGDCIYYSWGLYETTGSLIAAVSRGVSYKVIPEGDDKINFALEHALYGIKNYRIGRSKIVQEIIC